MTAPPSREQLRGAGETAKRLGATADVDLMRGEVWIKHADPRTGNTVMKRVTDFTEDGVKAAVAAAAAEMKQRQKETKNRMRAEREVNRE